MNIFQKCLKKWSARTPIFCIYPTWKFSLHMVFYGSPEYFLNGSHKIQKLFQLGFAWNGNLNNFCTGCPNSAFRGVKTRWCHRVIPTKSWEKSRSFRLRSSEDFWIKGKNPDRWQKVTNLGWYWLTGSSRKIWIQIRLPKNGWGSSHLSEKPGPDPDLTWNQDSKPNPTLKSFPSLCLSIF